MESLETGAPAARRVFLEAHEVPALVAGVALGRAAAARRVLGARRGGRAGVALALLVLALAAPSRRAAVGAVLLHGVLTLLAGLVNRRRAGHTTKEVQRLALWTALTPVCVAALVRPFAGGSVWPLAVAVVAGQALLWQALRATR
ncbi:MAG TPA: hypothetical protein VMR31_18690 [Myxococcota bacterium]|nr:hypothetical protein [Myxococcota bacterium]